MKWFNKTAMSAYDNAAVTSNDRNVMAYYQIGNVYADLVAKREYDEKYWQKTISVAPNSSDACHAAEMLKVIMK